MDRAVQYGDGFFTTMLVMDAKLYNWSAHWWRIQQSIERLGFPDLSEAAIQAQLASAVIDYQADESSVAPLMVKLMITRGQGGRGYQAQAAPQVTTIVQIAPHPTFRQSADFDSLPAALSLGLCKTQAAIQPQLAGLKHLNRLENVLARNELISQDFSEALMLNAEEEVICATQANLFMVKDKQLLTPKLTSSGVAGTTRYQLPEIAKQCGLIYKETTISLAEVQNADELFLTNALRGIMPVKSFQSRTYQTDVSLKIHQAWINWQHQYAKPLSGWLHD